MAASTSNAGWRAGVAIAIAIVGVVALVGGGGSVAAQSPTGIDNGTNTTADSPTVSSDNNTSLLVTGVSVDLLENGTTANGTGADEPLWIDGFVLQRTSEAVGAGQAGGLDGAADRNRTDRTGAGLAALGGGVEAGVGGPGLDGTVLDGTVLAGTGLDGTGTLTGLLLSAEDGDRAVAHGGVTQSATPTPVDRVERPGRDGRSLPVSRPRSPPVSGSDAGSPGTESSRSGGGSDLPGSPPSDAAMFGLGAVVAGAGIRRLTHVPRTVRGPSMLLRGWLDRIPPLLGPFRYSRYDDSDPLEHEDRLAVFRAVDASPGIYMAELSQNLNLSLSTLRHHAEVLEEEDLIGVASVRGRRRFYPTTTDQVELAAALNDEATAPIVDTLARLGAASVSDIAEAVDRDTSTLSYHLSRLEADGVVDRERDGRAIVNRLSAEVQEALASRPATEAGVEGADAAGDGAEDEPRDLEEEPAISAD